MLLYHSDKDISEGLKISVEETGTMETYLKFAGFQINEATFLKGINEANQLAFLTKIYYILIALRLMFRVFYWSKT